MKLFERRGANVEACVEETFVSFFSVGFRPTRRRFYKTIDVFIGCLYSQRRYLSRRPCGERSNNVISKTIRILLEIKRGG
jgi:hypothetical protein